MGEWTKPPWIVGRVGGTEFRAPHANDDTIVAAQSGICVGIVWSGEIGRFEVEQKSNAHLIAAAPELYAALEEARARIAGSNPGARALIDHIDAALKKARGES
jgi:hypothetical protein